MKLYIVCECWGFSTSPIAGVFDTRQAAEIECEKHDGFYEIREYTLNEVVKVD